MITVIVPCYNAAATLREAYESLPQDRSIGLEILLVDDGSNDGTRDLISELAALDDRVKPVLLASNAGVSAARNAGLDQASGDWIFFLDSDDKLRPECLGVLAEQTHGDVDFVRARHFLWDPETGDLLRNDGEELAFAEMHQIAPGAVPQITAVYSPWNALFRRDTIEASGLRFDRDLRIGEDRHFNMRFLKSCRKLTLLNDYTYLWRKPKHDTGQATQVLVKNPEEVFRGIRAQTELLAEKWFADNPRHRDYLATLMVVETTNFLHAFSRMLESGTMSDGARRDLNAILKTVRSDWIKLELAGLKGRDDIFTPLYTLTAQQVGRKVDSRFERSFLATLSEIRRSLNAPHSDATQGALSRTTFQWARKARPQDARQLEVEILRASNALDRNYYRDLYPDVAASGIDEVQHYVEFGAAELRNPNDWFATADYFGAHPGVFLAGINPLVHFVTESPHHMNWAI